MSDIFDSIAKDLFDEWLKPRRAWKAETREKWPEVADVCDAFDRKYDDREEAHCVMLSAGALRDQVAAAFRKNFTGTVFWQVVEAWSKATAAKELAARTCSTCRFHSKCDIERLSVNGNVNGAEFGCSIWQSPDMNAEP